MLALLACAALVGTPGAVLLSRHGTRDGASTRCVETTRASIMGAATTRFCDASALEFCRENADDDAQLTSQCERLETILPR